MAAGSRRRSDVVAVDAAADEAFIERAWQEGQRWRRDGMPWRYSDDAYGVWVSEVMLQQTTVKRVLDYWPRFMAAFPTLDALAAASTADVLERWQGLGYNRRALALKKTAEICAQTHGGLLPRAYDDLLALPGIGPATAAGIRAFAYELPGVYLETNVRSVYLSAYFPDAEGVPDRALIPIVERTCSQTNPREWYYALLDWGAHVKAKGENPARRSAHFTRQSAFEGSRRQKRAFIVREAIANPGISLRAVKEALDRAEQAGGRTPVEDDEFAAIVSSLEKEGFFTVDGGTIVT